jgi:hypothetical protein
LHKDVSFESEFHNIYDPQFSTPAGSVMNDESRVESYISIDTSFQEISFYAPESYLNKIERKSNSRESDGETTPKNVNLSLINAAKINQNKIQDLREPSFDLIFQNDNNISSSNLYSKYLNSNQNKEEIICSSSIENNALKSKELLENISKDFATANDPTDQKEIQKTSFYKDLVLDPSALFQNTLDMKSFNLGDRIKEYKEFNVFDKRNKDNIHLYQGIPMYDSEEKDKITKPWFGNTQFSPDKDEIGDSQPINIPIDMTNSYEHESNKYTGRLEHHRSDNVINHYSNQTKELSSADFILRTMHSLEFLKNKIYDSSNISKNRDESIKSCDFVSSPEASKTKDTSAFLGSKILRNFMGNKTQILLNNNSSILENINIQKLATSDELRVKRNSRKVNNQNSEYNVKTKYLTGTLDRQDLTSFADKIEAINFRESKKNTVLKSSCKYNQFYHLASKPSANNSMVNLMRLNSARTNYNYNPYTKTPNDNIIHTKVKSK